MTGRPAAGEVSLHGLTVHGCEHGRVVVYVDHGWKHVKDDGRATEPCTAVPTLRAMTLPDRFAGRLKEPYRPQGLFG